MTPGPAADPVRATFVAILQQLNRAESVNEGRQHEQSLPLQDLAYSLRDFWAVEERRVQLPQALGLLVRNGLVRSEAGARPPKGPAPPTRYRITAEGKQFLVDSVAKADRIQ